jgi:hypothetical protein
VACGSRGGNGAVHVGRGRGDDVPHPVEVADLERPAMDRDRRRLDLGVDDRRDDRDVSLGIDQRLELRRRDGAGADDEHALAGQAQEGREERGNGRRRTMVAHARASGRVSGRVSGRASGRVSGRALRLSSAGVSGITCSPHSVFSLPRHRPARSSSPSLTGLVQVRQEMLG